ncbi:MAG: hypothetical protein PGN33_10280 [Methylobacterium radiotolerans]
MRDCLLKSSRYATIAAATIAVSGCSIYPVVQESTGSDTYTVVKHVRCEARDAIASKLISIAAQNYAKVRAYKNLTGQAFADSLLPGGPEKIWTVDWRFLDPRLRANWNYYARASISYDFTLDIEEQNNQDVTLDFTATKFATASKLPFSLNNDRLRQVQRNFRVYDQWVDLFRNPRWHTYCSDIERGPNFLYPIAGTLNIRDMVRQFVDLNQSGNLGGLKDPDAIFSKQLSDVSPTMSDTATFTTKIEANADPAAIVGPVLKRYTLTDFSLKFDNYRRDMHKVIIVMSLPADQGGFTSSRAELAATGLPTPSDRILAATELSRQRAVATQDSLIRLGSSNSRILP